MDAYIDRQALYEAIRQLADETECNIAVLPDVAEKIREAPAADVAPVKHGRLGPVYTDEYYGEFRDCMECGAINIIPCNYCRNCGAKMDGGTQ